MVAFNIRKRRNPLIAATHSFLVKVKFYHKMLETNACVFCDDNVIIFIFLKMLPYYIRILFDVFDYIIHLIIYFNTTVLI